MQPATGVRLLLVEDDPDDARFVKRLLTDFRVGNYDNRPIEIEAVEHVDTFADGRDMVDSLSPDIVILDLGLPDSSGIQTVEKMVQHAPTLPVVVLTGQSNSGIEAIRSGAQDYLLKGRITAPLLLRSLRYAIERSRVTKELRDRNTRLAVANELLRGDLRDDIGLIVGLIDQIEAAVGPTDQNTVESLFNTSQHALELTNTVADLMDVLNGEPFAQRGPSDLRAVLESEINQFQEQHNVDIVLQWHTSTDDPLVVSGTPLLGSVFAHLLSNVSLQSNERASRIDMTVTATDNDVSVAITDDDLEFPDSKKEAINASDPRTAAQSRLSSDLFFVTTVLERIDGSIEITDNSSPGTVMTVTLERTRSSVTPD
ncbi:hybrid sensor histidine kinase/response regulator [Halobellus captivus]|uniref:hybrid sensor histidine kinase/response regulator n=1 Tax=Halobellus captivus TaxID=2592614 RepID=UPI00119F8786|nr:response regulator [Halobellus captivus]